MFRTVLTWFCSFSRTEKCFWDCSTWST